MVKQQLQLSIEEQKAWAGYLNWLRRARENGTIHEALKQYYRDEENKFYSIEANGEQFTLPFMTLPEWVGLDGSLNDFVGKMSHTASTSHHNETIEGVAQELYIRQRRGGGQVEPEFFRTNDVLWNGGTYRVTGLVDSETVSCSLELSDFYSYVSVQEKMLRELYHALEEIGMGNKEEVDIDKVKSKLTQRNNMASSFNEIVDWKNHYHNASPVCLLVVNRLGKSPEIYLVERSNDVLHEPGVMSVAPAGEVTPDAGMGPDFQQAIVRELVEELMGVPESHHPDASNANELERRIWAHVVAGQISIRRTGLGFSLDSPRPCFSGIVFVRDPDIGEWISDKLAINWEFKRAKKYTLPIDEVPDGMGSSKASVPGSFAFFEGIRYLERMGVETGLNPALVGPR